MLNEPTLRANRFCNMANLTSPDQLDLRTLDHILLLTAFVSGTIDIISFVSLGGVFASAMTGNLALLGLYISRFSLFSALGSLLALVAFVIGSFVGAMIARGRTQAAALHRIIALEALCILVAGILWLRGGYGTNTAIREWLIILLAVAMGLQSIAGKRINLSNIPTVVFTSTLTNIVIALADMLAHRSRTLPPDTKRQCKSFLSYFGGVICAGIVLEVTALGVICLPVIGVSTALYLALCGSSRQ